MRTRGVSLYAAAQLKDELIDEPALAGILVRGVGEVHGGRTMRRGRAAVKRLARCSCEP